MESTDDSNFLHTLGGIPLAFITWVVIYTLAHVALYLLDTTRGLDGDRLQGVFRELFTPGLGGYVAIYSVAKYLPKANLNFVAIVYCFTIFSLYLLFSLYMIIFQGSKYDFSLGEQMLGWGLAIATCAGSFIAIKNINP